MSTPEPQSNSAAAQASLPRRLLRYVLPLICLLQLGVLASWWLDLNAALHPLPASLRDNPQPPEQPKSLPKPQPAQPSEPLPDPRKGEALFRQGDYALALPHFMPADKSKSAWPAASYYQAALCLEALGRWKEALTAHRTAVAQAKDPWLETAAQVGQARIWVRQQQPAEAKKLLFPIILSMPQRNRCDAALGAEAHFLLGLALAQEAQSGRQPSAFDDNLVRSSQVPWPLDHTAAWIRPAPEVKEPAKALPPALAVVQPFGDRAEEVLIRGTAEPTAVEALVGALAALIKVRVESSAAASQQLRDRTASLAVDAVPLPEVVQALVEPLGLHARFQAGVLSIAVEAEVPAAELATSRGAAARRTLRAAVYAHADHPLAPLGYMELGGDAALSDNLEDAATWYEKLIGETNRSAYVSVAYYNLGLVHKARRDYAGARKAFYRVVDRSPGHELTPNAFWQIGSTYLLQGQYAEALIPLRRAVAVSPGHADAAVTLATAALLNGNPGEAHQVLNKAREYVNQDPWRTAAAFLDALARYRLAGAGKASRQDSAELLAALLGLQKYNTLGPAGHVLAGRACAELGLVQEMAAIYEAGLPKAAGPMAEEMRFGLAEHYCATGKREAGVKHLEILAATKSGKWSPAARLRLAGLALKDGKAQQCLDSCAAMLQEPEMGDRTAILQIMGAAYEKLGDYEKAARCLAGQLPN